MAASSATRAATHRRARIDRAFTRRCRKLKAGESATQRRARLLRALRYGAMFRRKPALPAPSDRLLVIRLRIRKGGSSAGNHGMDSLIASFGSKDFIRFRVGIGRPPGNGVDYVLSPFTAAEQAQVPDVASRVADAVLVTIDQGLERAMTE